MKQIEILLIEYEAIINKILIFILLGMGFLYFTPINHLTHISLWDESWSLYRGVNWNYSQFQLLENSPLYSFLYHLEHYFFNDKVALYYANNYIVKVTFLMVIFIFTIKTTQSLLISISVFLAFFYSYMDVWPLINYFTSIILLIGAMIIIKTKCLYTKIASMVLLSFVLSFIRPEFALAFLLLIMINILQIILQYKRIRFRSLIRIISIYMLIITFSFQFTFPTISSSDRSLVAIGQHYSLNKYESKQTNLNPWIQWEAIVNKDFNNPTSIIDLIKNNPKQFLWHISMNVKNVLYKIPFYVDILILSMIFYILIILWQERRNIENDSLVSNSYLYLSFSSLFLPILIALILIYPREHYLLLFTVLLVVSFSYIISLLPKLKMNRMPIFQFSASVILITLYIVYPPKVVKFDNDIVKNNITVLRNIEQNYTIGKFLDMDGGMHIYLSTIDTSTSDVSKSSEWYIKNIDTIFVSKLLINNAGDGLNKILTLPNLFGFNKIPISKEYYLLAHINYKTMDISPSNININTKLCNTIGGTQFPIAVWGKDSRIITPTYKLNPSTYSLNINVKNLNIDFNVEIFKYENGTKVLIKKQKFEQYKNFRYIKLFFNLKEVSPIFIDISIAKINNDKIKALWINEIFISNLIQK